MQDRLSGASTESEILERELERQIRYRLARTPSETTRHERYLALGNAVRDLVVERWLATNERYRADNVRMVCYLSAEFHIGRLLRSALQALGQEELFARALESMGASLDDLEEEEAEPGLGSGGLGRLAACFMDSLATMDLPARGYGLRYELGLFRQVIKDGEQHEEPQDWLRGGGMVPWEIKVPDESVVLQFFGRVEFSEDGEGRLHYRWVDSVNLLAVPHDVPVPGYGTGTVSTLRLWSARPADAGLDLGAFQRGEYWQAWGARNLAASINAFLYPSDHTQAGKELRLMQQYMLASATLQDQLRRILAHPVPPNALELLAEKVVFQLNDTHPAIAIAEMMRLLVDEHGFNWEPSWETTQKVFAYTNHTLLPEALETWSADLMGRLLPRHLQIIQEIDRRFRAEMRGALPKVDDERIARMAIFDGHDGGRVRMAHLAVHGSSSVNGVAALHTQLLKAGLLNDFYELYPRRFNNKTNGITPRRWLLQCNPGLASLITEHLGSDWERDLDRLRGLEPLAGDPAFQAAFRRVKLENKRRLAVEIQRRAGVDVDPNSLFDVQIKRFHEYKRQLLQVLWVVDRYLLLRAEPDADVVPRTVVFAGKAAHSYVAAKRIVHLIHAVARVVNQDPRVSPKLKVAFVPDYSVTLAQVIFPATELSEQISTAGYEASGTGNMKATLNGALILGTLDGANVEIREEVGYENIFFFGLEADEVRRMREREYVPRRYYEGDPRLRAVLDAIAGDTFPPGVFQPVVDALLERDRYLVLADFRALCEAQERVDAAYRDTAGWTRRAILNTARMGKFSSDRTIREYAEDIWRVEPLRVEPPKRG